MSTAAAGPGWAGCGIPSTSPKGYHTTTRGQSQTMHTPVPSRAAPGLPCGRVAVWSGWRRVDEMPHSPSVQDIGDPAGTPLVLVMILACAPRVPTGTHGEPRAMTDRNSLTAHGTTSQLTSRDSPHLSRRYSGPSYELGRDLWVVHRKMSRLLRQEVWLVIAARVKSPPHRGLRGGWTLLGLFRDTRRASHPLALMTFMIFVRLVLSPSSSRPQNRVVMSMQPRPWPEVPADTAWVARKAFRKGMLAIRARDELGAWYDDAAFAGAYGARGKPGISRAQLAMVTALQVQREPDRAAGGGCGVGPAGLEVLPGPGAGG
jgi:hypothetical protein